MRKPRLMWSLIILLVVFLMQFFMQKQVSVGPPALAYSDFIKAVEAKQVTDVTVRGQAIKGHEVNGKPFRTMMPVNENIADRLHGTNITINVEKNDPPNSFESLVLSWLPMLLLLVCFIFFRQRIKSGRNP